MFFALLKERALKGGTLIAGRTLELSGQLKNSVKLRRIFRIRLFNKEDREVP